MRENATRNSPPLRLAVVGGGAAGLFGAITAAEANPAARVILFEATDEPLDKVRISGGGRCNVTHHCFDPAELVKNYPRGFRELRGPFSRFQPGDTVEWFRRRGVRVKAEPDGRMFPVTDSSETIVTCLLDTARRARVDLRLRARVKTITRTPAGDGGSSFAIESHDGSHELFDRVLIATGSSPQGHRLAQALGHSLIPPVPSLFTFKVSDPRLTDLSGLSFEKVHLRLTAGDHRPFEQTGPMLITHWGLSGPAILKLSAWGARALKEQNYRANLHVNFTPGRTSDDIYATLVTAKAAHARRHVDRENPVELPKRYWTRLVHTAGVSPDTLWTNLTREAMHDIAQQLTSAHFAVRGKGIFKEEFVTCGGVPLTEVDFRTMESKLTPGLFFAGEILDIDGITGGFNFQSAWTTGFIAGLALAES